MSAELQAQDRGSGLLPPCCLPWSTLARVGWSGGAVSPRPQPQNKSSFYNSGIHGSISIALCGIVFCSGFKFLIE